LSKLFPANQKPYQRLGIQGVFFFNKSKILPKIRDTRAFKNNLNYKQKLNLKKKLNRKTTSHTTTAIHCNLKILSQARQFAAWGECAGRMATRPGGMVGHAVEKTAPNCTMTYLPTYLPSYLHKYQT
jgi:hypothetical protein